MILSSKDVAQILLDKKAVQVNTEDPFTWASGIKSPIYCDNRKLISYPKERDLLVGALIELAKNYEFDFLAGTATAGIPWCAMMAQMMKVPMVYVRSKPKEHGLKNMIEGEIIGRKCLVIEDLISTGKSSITAVNALKSQDVQTNKVLSLFSYNLELAEDTFQKADLEYLSLANLRDLEKLLGEQIIIPNT